MADINCRKADSYVRRRTALYSESDIKPWQTFHQHTSALWYVASCTANRWKFINQTIFKPWRFPQLRDEATIHVRSLIRHKDGQQTTLQAVIAVWMNSCVYVSNLQTIYSSTRFFFFPPLWSISPLISVLTLPNITSHLYSILFSNPTIFLPFVCPLRCLLILKQTALLAIHSRSYSCTVSAVIQYACPLSRWTVIP